MKRECGRRFDALHGKAGADIIVVGDAIEKETNLISEIADAIHNCS